MQLFIQAEDETCLHEVTITKYEGDTKPFTVYRDWSGYGYQAGHIEMECKHSHVNWTEKDLETIRTAEKVRRSVSSLLSIYLL